MTVGESRREPRLKAPARSLRTEPLLKDKAIELARKLGIARTRDLRDRNLQTLPLQAMLRGDAQASRVWAVRGAEGGRMITRAKAPEERAWRIRPDSATPWQAGAAISSHGGADRLAGGCRPERRRC